MMTMKTTILGCAVVCVAMLATSSLAQQEGSNRKPGATTAPTTQSKRFSDPSLLDVCVVSGEKLGSMGDPIVKQYDGREIRFCCKGCIKKFEKDSATYWKKVDEQIVKRQMPFYPFDTCMVSGEELASDEMGDPIDFVYNNRLIRFCCNGCKRKFLKDTNAFLKKLDEAVIAKQRENYPLQTCPISGEKLDSMGEPVEKIYGNRLVRFCCNACVKKFEKNPTAHVAALDKAWKELHGANDSHDGQKADDKSDHSEKTGHEGHDHGNHDHEDHGG